MAPEKEKGTWARYPFDEATNLWMNTTHDEALKWLAQIINREKKSIDFAQTFAKRNSLKHLSGIQKAPGTHGPFSRNVGGRSPGTSSNGMLPSTRIFRPASGN